MVVLTETFDPGWRLSDPPPFLTATHQRVDGYANAWLIDGTGTFDLTIEYAPARRARLALVASMLAAVAALGTVVVAGGRAMCRRRRRGPRPGEQDGEALS